MSPYVKHLDDDVRLVVSYKYTPGDPGRTSGPPERCYPPEPPEVEFLTVQLVHPGQPPADILPFVASELCEDAREKLETEIIAWEIECEQAEEQEHYDRLADERRYR